MSPVQYPKHKPLTQATHPGQLPNCFMLPVSTKKVEDLVCRANIGGLRIGMGFCGNYRSCNRVLLAPNCSDPFVEITGVRLALYGNVRSKDFISISPPPP